MKVIDLLNKIANGEETPKKVKWRGVIFRYVEEENYEDYINDMNCSLFRHDDDIYKVTNMLDDEVEIVEEEKEIEKLDIEESERYIRKENNKCVNLSVPDCELAIKINEIIDKINSLSNKE